jgi:membrane protein implicated in regulation of membrane protease activity
MLLLLAIVGLFLIPEPWNVVVVCIAALIEVGEVFVWRKFLRRYRVQTGAEGLVGQRGEVIGPDRVRVRGEIWSASGAGQLITGDLVRVAAVEGLTLVVEPESSPAGNTRL